MYSSAQTHDVLSASLACSVVIVSFHSSGMLERCLRLLQKRAGSIRIEIIVVNNSWADRAEVGAVCSKFQVAFIQSNSNLGYARACNLGAHSASGPIVLFLNPEVILSYESIRIMVEILETSTGTVAMGPLQGRLNGKVRGKRRVIGQSRFAANSTLRKLGAADAISETSFLPRGALMVRKDAFFAVGGFDERIFLNHEDDDLCLRLATIGSLAYAAGVVAFHDHGTSRSAPPQVTFARAWHLGYSRVLVLRKHYGNWASLSPLCEAMANFVSLKMLTVRGRRNAVAFLSGAMSAYRRPEQAMEVVPS